MQFPNWQICAASHSAVEAHPPADTFFAQRPPWHVSVAAAHCALVVQTVGPVYVQTLALVQAHSPRRQAVPTSVMVCPMQSLSSRQLGVPETHLPLWQTRLWPLVEQSASLAHWDGSVMVLREQVPLVQTQARGFVQRSSFEKQSALLPHAVRSTQTPF